MDGLPDEEGTWFIATAFFTHVRSKGKFSNKISPGKEKKSIQAFSTVKNLENGGTGI